MKTNNSNGYLESGHGVPEEEKEDFLSKIIGHWKKRGNANSELITKKEDVEEDALARLSTLDEKTNATRAKTMKRLVLVAGGLSVGMFIIVGAFKTLMILKHQEERKPITTKVQDVKLEINSFTKWQEIKDQEVTQLGSDIKNVEITLDKKITDVQTAITQELNTTASSIGSKIEEVQKNNKEVLVNTLDELKSEIQRANIDSKQYADQQKLSIQEKIEKVEANAKEAAKKEASNSDKLDFSKLSLPPLPGLKAPIEKNKIGAGANIQNAYEKPIEIEEEISKSATIEVSTLASDVNPKSPNKDEPISFTLMPGFTKGMLVTGADVPTLSRGADVSRAVWISTSGDMLIANNHKLNVKECLIQAAATGNFASGVAEIRLSEISCSALDNKGQYYKISSAVKGWVYGENGKYGLKGRLVSKEGEIIKKAIPLAILEGAIKALENSTEKTPTYGIYGGGTSSSQGTMTTAGSDAFSGATSGKATTGVLNKFTDYYLKILEAMNPVIEIKAGRTVTVAFAGNETFKLEKYTPADVDFFENKGLGDD